MSLFNCQDNFPGDPGPFLPAIARLLEMDKFLELLSLLRLESHKCRLKSPVLREEFLTQSLSAAVAGSRPAFSGYSAASAGSR